jgi:hypothetical protein
MSKRQVQVWLDGNRTAYRPGELLGGNYQLVGADRSRVRRTEVSVLWYTEGKGTEDLGVHHFAESDTPDDSAGRFATQLPLSPLSYDGVLLKIRWLVRVRVQLTTGRELLGEAPFQLGEAGIPGRAPRP